MLVYQRVSAFLSLAGLYFHVIPMDFWKAHSFPSSSGRRGDSEVDGRGRHRRWSEKREASATWWRACAAGKTWENHFRYGGTWGNYRLRDVMGKPASWFSTSFICYRRGSMYQETKNLFLAVIYRVISCNIWDWPWLSRLSGELLYRNMVSNGGYIIFYLSYIYCNIIASPAGRSAWVWLYQMKPFTLFLWILQCRFADWENTPGLGAQKTEP